MASALHPPNASGPAPEGTGPGAAGLAFVIRFAIGFANATYSSVTSLPAGAVVLRAFLDITTNYGAEPGPPTLSMGTVADGASAFMAAGDNNPTIVDLYDAPQDTVSAGGPVVVTVGGSPNEGAGFACVEYAVPAP